MIEHVRGEKDAHCVFVVKVLEELCEKIYNCYESAAEGDEKGLFPIREVLEKLDNALSEHILSRREILFMPESTEGVAEGQMTALGSSTDMKHDENKAVTER